jgi:hypothetical protein
MNQKRRPGRRHLTLVRKRGMPLRIMLKAMIGSFTATPSPQ